MAIRKTKEQQLADIETKLEQLKAQKKAIQQKQKQEQRKARTKHLIEVGALVEKYCGTITDMNKFSKYLDTYAYAIKRTQE